MKVFITGIDGFVGSNLVAYLLKNGDYQIYGWSLNVAEAKKKLPEKVTLYEKEEAFNELNFDAIIHLAGKAHDLKSTSEESAYYEVNTELTKRMLDWYQRSECSHFIFISSVKAVADSVEGILDEDFPANPVTAYGKSKMLAEKYIRENSTKNYTILRPVMIHGPGNKGNLNLLYSFVSKGIPYPFGAFNNQRSFLSVFNFCFAIDQILKKKITGTFNIADTGYLSTNELVKLIGEADNKKAKVWKLPPSSMRFVAAIGDFLPLPVNTEKLNKLTENYRSSNARLLTQIGTEFPVTVEEGIKTTVKSFKK